MVKNCSHEYPAESEQVYQEYFEKYPFPLSSFQKYAIESIVTGNHVLVTAHTGSGKTLPAEFAIEYFVNQGKKVIYTSPIKALSNQKFYEFSQKFPHISFGILTGDIKTNPEADVLIMTTEILLNTLYLKCLNTETIVKTTASSSHFEMDFQSELACVIFDEIHYINDAERGKVWEETIMMLPKHVQMVLLSATLHSPEKFALWCETVSNETQKTVSNETQKTVYLATTYNRVVPLTHYAYITCTQGLIKNLKDKALEMEVMRTTNSLHVIQDSSGIFNEPNYLQVNKMLKLFELKEHYVKRTHVLNTVTKHLVDNAMLPAICFVLSRKALEQCAKEVTTVLLEDDSKVPYIVRRDCEQIIRKLPNFQEYLNLKEYNDLVALLEKGIAIHHAGMMPILREMVELLFAKGYVKLLFATETFAVGINMPTKTVLFTDVSKYDGKAHRLLYAHEYTQMAGRAGRRGLDTIGYVIHLPNLYRKHSQPEFREMLKGKPQMLKSKFKISYNLVLNLIQQGPERINSYVKQSMIQSGTLEPHLNALREEIKKKEKEVQAAEEVLQLFGSSVPKEEALMWTQLSQTVKHLVNKKRKEAERTISRMLNQYNDIDKVSKMYTSYDTKVAELADLHKEVTVVENMMDNNVAKVLDILTTHDFVNPLNNALTPRGINALNIREVHSLLFADLIEDKKLQHLTPNELAAFFSCFTNISVPDEVKTEEPTTQMVLKTLLNESVIEQLNGYRHCELERGINTGTNYDIHYDIIDEVLQWTNCETEEDSKLLLYKLNEEKSVFIGEFVKAILKINNIAAELEGVAEQMDNIAFLHSLKQIPSLTLKFVATNQSLYV